MNAPPPNAPPPTNAPPPARPPRPRDPNFGWFIGAGAGAIILGIINMLAAAVSECVSACDSTFHNAAEARKEGDLAAFYLVLGILSITGAGLSFGRVLTGAILVALAALGDASLFAIQSKGHPQALPVVVLALATAAVAITGAVKRVLDGRATPPPEPPTIG